ncbi:MAG: hypothetical protein GAK43_00505 [Stenotrophomonas maltophilia]|nr:MAG: hypothetical protein GAK43_00505 [Stenotrophomonas maltophilia]
MPELDPHRWQTLWQQLGAPAPSGSFEHLQQAYTQPDRHYHGSAHILACLRHFDTWRSLAQAPATVELALWLHDVVYDTHRQDNEAASAELASQWLQAAGLSPLSATVQAMILATRHDAVVSEADAALVVDLDLAILASPAPSYRAYAQAVRAEYAWVPEAAFRAGRGKLLTQLLALPQLYQRAELRQHWEAPARANLQAECDDLLGS